MIRTKNSAAQPQLTTEDWVERAEHMRALMGLVKRGQTIMRQISRVAKDIDQTCGVRGLTIEDFGEVYATQWHTNDSLGQLLGEWKCVRMQKRMPRRRRLGGAR
jgi:hypothetical protein